MQGYEFKTLSNKSIIIPESLSIGAMPRTSSELHCLKREGVTAILNLTEPHEGACTETPHGMSRLDLATPDNEPDGKGRRVGAVLSHLVINRGIEWAEAMMRAGKHVYVHCQFGANRSAIIVIGILCHYKRMRIAEAIQKVKTLHPTTNPNFLQLGSLCFALEALEATDREYITSRMKKQHTPTQHKQKAARATGSEPHQVRAAGSACNDPAFCKQCHMRRRGCTGKPEGRNAD